MIGDGDTFAVNQNCWGCQILGRVLCRPLASETNLPPGTDGQQSGLVY